MNSLRMVWDLPIVCGTLSVFKEEGPQTASIVVSRNTNLCNWRPIIFVRGAFRGPAEPLYIYLFLSISICYINFLKYFLDFQSRFSYSPDCEGVIRRKSMALSF